MLLIVRQCFLMVLSRKITVRKATLQTANKFFFQDVRTGSNKTSYGDKIFTLFKEA